MVKKGGLGWKIRRVTHCSLPGEALGGEQLAPGSGGWTRDACMAGI